MKFQLTLALIVGCYSFLGAQSAFARDWTQPQMVGPLGVDGLHRIYVIQPPMGGQPYSLSHESTGNCHPIMVTIDSNMPDAKAMLSVLNMAKADGRNVIFYGTCVSGTEFSATAVTTGVEGLPN